MHRSADTLASAYDVTLIGPNGARESAPEGMRVIECPSGAPLFLICSLLVGALQCLRNRYHCVFGGSGLVSPVTAVLGRLCGARRGLYVHGLDLVADSWIYQKLFIPQIIKHDFVIANSANTRDIVIAKGCAPTAVSVLHPGTDLPDRARLQTESAQTRSELGLGDRKIVLFAGRIIERKGLRPYIEHAWQQTVDRHPDARLLVVGDSPQSAVDRGHRGGAKIADALVANGLSDSVQFLGRVSDEVLWRCYALADVMVFPLVDTPGDVEGFGMVAIEAAACGTPTVAFAAGGVVDAVSEGLSGRLIEKGRYDSFAAAVSAVLDGDSPNPSECRRFAEQFGWQRHGDQLLEILANELDR